MRPDPSVVKSKLAEIDRRYKRKRRRFGPPSMAALRVRDLTKLFAARYGETFPDDDAGRDDARIMAHHLSGLSGDPRKNIGEWLRWRCPWMSLIEADAVVTEATMRPRRWRADKLAWRLHLIEADRAELGITTIGSIDVDKAERARRRKDHDRKRKRQQREARGAKARAEYEAKSINRTKPWTALGISRATWYRRRETSAATA